MKFVCENCKAKYQIGDDKVSGKTVRMKCRRCGHLILVSATVTESSVAKHAPAEGAPLGSSMAGQPTPPPGALQAPAPGLTNVGDDDEEASTVIMSAPAALRMAPTKPAVPAPGGPHPGPQAPRAGGTQAMPATPTQPPKAPIAPGRPPPPKPSVPGRPSGGASPFVPAAAPSAPSVADLAQRSMSSAISAAARGTSNPVGPSRGGVARGHLALAPNPAPAPSAPSHLAPVPTPPGNTPSVVPPSGGVAGAFQRVAAAPAPAALRVETPGEDWYVGVGGVPIGPVRLSVIREKVEQGAVDGESLVWREGFEEWQPLRNVPGLRAILDEPRRATSPTPPPEGPNGKISSSSLPRVSMSAANGAAFGATPPAAPSHASVAATASAPPAPETTGQAALSSLVSTGGVALGPAASATDPSAVPSPDPGTPLPPPAGPASPVLASKPASIAPPASIPPPSREERKKGMHPFAYAMIAMAAVFGGVAAWVLLIKAPPEPTIIVKTVTADPGLNAAPPPPPTEKPGEAPAPSASADAKTPTGPIAQGGPRPSSAPSTKPGDPPPPNLDSFGSGPGPTTGPSTPDNGGGNGKLSEGEIQGVVSRNQSRVRRQCWQPALDASSGSGPKSARVSTTITIGPGGNVTNVNASGAENFPGLASCVGGAIRGWSFPKSEGSTTVNVPFSFNAQ